MTIKRRGATRRTGSQRCRFHSQVPRQGAARRHITLVRASCFLNSSLRRLRRLRYRSPSRPKEQSNSCPPVSSPTTSSVRNSSEHDSPVAGKRHLDVLTFWPTASFCVDHTPCHQKKCPLCYVASATPAAMQHRTCHLGGRVHDIRAHIWHHSELLL